VAPAGGEAAADEMKLSLGDGALEPSTSLEL